jgi:hypothetical protein
MDPRAQALILGTEGATAQATSIDQSQPRGAAAAASTIQQCSGPRCNHGATHTTSRTSEKSTADDPNIFYGPDGLTVWEHRPKDCTELDETCSEACSCRTQCYNPTIDSSS